MVSTSATSDDDDGSTSERQPRQDLAGDPLLRPRNVSATSTTAGTCQWTVDSNVVDGDASRPRRQRLELPGDRLTRTRTSLYGKCTSWRLTDDQRRASVRQVDPSSRQTLSDNWATVFVASDTDWKLCRLSWEALMNDVSLQQRSDSIWLRKFAHEAYRNFVAITRSENCQTSGDGHQLHRLETITRRQVWNTFIARASRIGGGTAQLENTKSRPHTANTWQVQNKC